MNLRRSAAERVAKSTLETYKAVRQVKERTQQKLDTLLHMPSYEFFDFESKHKHPYHTLAATAQELLDAFEALVSGIKDWHIGVDTLGDELEKIKADHIWKKEPDDIDLDHLRAIKSSTMTTQEAAEKFLSVIDVANDLRNMSTDQHLRSEIEKLFTRDDQKPKVKKQLVSRNTEAPKVDVAKECAAAFKATRELGKHLSRCGIDGRTIRDEFETIQNNLDKKDFFTAIGSGNGREKHWVDWYLKQRSN